MSENKRAMIRGHEPLRVPSNWKNEDRAFVVQLERLLDDIYSRFGRLGMKDLSPELQEAINEEYDLPLAADGTRGGVQTGFTESGKNYPVELEDEKMFVNVPWETTPVYNGLDKTAEGFALDARQGKAIWDALGQYNMPDSIAPDLNNCKTQGLYRATKAGTTNKPDANQYYVVQVLTYGSGDLAQIAVDVNNGHMWRRSWHDSTTWTSWERLVTQSEFDSKVGRRMQAVYMQYSFPVTIPRDSWICGILICNTAGGGNGVYYCDLTTNSSNFHYTTIVANQGNQTKITATTSGTTMTIAPTTPAGVAMRFDYAVWIGL